MDLHVLENEIIKSLKMRAANGESEREIAKKAGVSPGHINHIKNQKRNATGLSIESLSKLFPKATINLHGDSTINGPVVNHGHNNGVMGINHGIINQSCMDAVTDKILKDDELTAEEKVKVLGILRK